jgi:hypothetical protein
MPQYQTRFTPDDFDRYREALRKATFGHCSFDANDALAAIMQGAGWPLNAGDVATLLGDLTDLGYLRHLPDDGGPHRFIWVDESPES